MRSAFKDLHFPLGGLSRVFSFHDDETRRSSKGAYCTESCANVWPKCVFANRLRGGSRPFFTGTSRSENSEWYWPNGERIAWPSSDIVAFEDHSVVTDDDGGNILDTPDFVLSATKGTAPSNPSVIALYRARLIAAEGAIWYASRSGDFHDWDYGGDIADRSRACAGNVALTATSVGSDITAVIPVNDSLLIVATADTIVCYPGDLTEGQRTVVSSEVGVVSKYAWAWDGQKLVFLSARGLYAYAPGGGVQLLSSALPDDLRNVREAVLAYDPEYAGYHVFTLRNTDYFVDLDNGGSFWPYAYPDNSARPVAVSRILKDGKIDQTLFTDASGNTHKLSRTVKTDFGATATSFVTLGPLRLSQADDGDALLDTLTVSPSSETDSSATFSIRVSTGYSADEAQANADAGVYAWQFSFRPGWNHVARPRVRGPWFVLRLAVSGGRWAYEGIHLTSKLLGRLR